MAASEKLALVGVWDTESTLPIDVVATMMSGLWQVARKMKRAERKNKSSARVTTVKGRLTMKTERNANTEVSEKNMVMVERVRIQVELQLSWVCKPG